MLTFFTPPPLLSPFYTRKANLLQNEASFKYVVYKWQQASFPPLACTQAIRRGYPSVAFVHSWVSAHRVRTCGKTDFGFADFGRLRAFLAEVGRLVDAVGRLYGDGTAGGL